MSNLLNNYDFILKIFEKLKIILFFILGFVLIFLEWIFSKRLSHVRSWEVDQKNCLKSFYENRSICERNI